MTNYSNLPSHMQEAAQLYVEKGVEPGSFLRVVVENKFLEAFMNADEVNTNSMRVWAAWLYSDAPHSCHGSPEIVEKWVKHKGLQGYKG